MDKNFFQKIRILDGGMGQEILNRGVKPYGTIWGATALLFKKVFFFLKVQLKQAIIINTSDIGCLQLK